MCRPGKNRHTGLPLLVYESSFRDNKGQNEQTHKLKHTHTHTVCTTIKGNRFTMIGKDVKIYTNSPPSIELRQKLETDVLKIPGSQVKLLNSCNFHLLLDAKS